MAARITTALYTVVETEGQSVNDVMFRVRAPRAEQSGHAWLGALHGEPKHATIEVNAAAGGVLTIDVDHSFPALVNDHTVTGAIERAAQRVIGSANILTA